MDGSFLKIKLVFKTLDWKMENQIPQCLILASVILIQNKIYDCFNM